ncbi:BTB/POZ protein [Haematococcus lacustris]
MASSSKETTDVPSSKIDGLSMVLSKFKGGLESFQSLIQELNQAVEKEREQLKADREKLEAERRQFEEESQRVQQVLRDGEQVVLNVGGSKFTTTLTTLRNAPSSSPSLFTAMFSGRHNLRTDEAGCFFVDRDARHFHAILNYLRDGQLNYPSDGTDFKYLLELRAEAEYYGLTGLVALIDRYPYGLTRIQRAANLNTEDSWMYEDGQDEVVFTVDRACQLLGVGLCGTQGAYTVELDVYEVEPEEYSNEVCTLQSVAQSFTKTDGQLIRLYLNSPALLQPNKFYMLSALIKGTESFCCEECMDTVIAGGVKVSFQSWESPNGTNEARGQFPELYIRVV